MRVAVTGATGVIGTSAVPALVASGHEVIGLARDRAKAAQLEELGACAVEANLFDHDSLVAMFHGCDAVCSLATHIPVGYPAALPWSWRQNDRLRTEGVRRVADAARVAGVRRLVQESVSYLYADQGDEPITEQSPLAITRATEPASVGESLVQGYQCGSRQGVVIRFGTIIGDDRLTRWSLKAAGRGRPIGTGIPDSFAHVVHTDDLGSAVVAALSAPSGVYNAGSAPVRRRELFQGYADAAGQRSAGFMGPLLRRLAGPRAEPLARSLRVSSQHFMDQTGWTPRRASFDASWFGLAGSSKALR